MAATRLSLADDFGLELELAPDYVLVRIDPSNEVAAQNRRRGRRMGELLKEADQILEVAEPPKGEEVEPETDEETETRLAEADAKYDEARDVLLEVVASQTVVAGTEPPAAPELDELRRRLPTLAHAMWASNGLSHEANLDPTRRKETSSQTSPSSRTTRA